MFGQPFQQAAMQMFVRDIRLIRFQSYASSKQFMEYTEQIKIAIKAIFIVFFSRAELNYNLEFCGSCQTWNCEGPFTLRESKI